MRSDRFIALSILAHGAVLAAITYMVGPDKIVDSIKSAVGQQDVVFKEDGPADSEAVKTETEATSAVPAVTETTPTATTPAPTSATGEAATKPAVAPPPAKKWARKSPGKTAQTQTSGGGDDGESKDKESAVADTPAASNLKRINEIPPAGITAAGADSEKEKSKENESDKDAGKTEAASQDMKKAFDATKDGQPGTDEFTQGGELGKGGATKSVAVEFTELKQAKGNKMPIYPLAARKEKRQGQTVLLYRVTKEGRVADVEIEQSSGSDDLDKEATRAIAKFRYVPGQEGWTRHPVSFTLKGEPATEPIRLRTANKAPGTGAPTQQAAKASSGNGSNSGDGDTGGDSSSEKLSRTPPPTQLGAEDGE